jgi:hypothetical protein
VSRAAKIASATVVIDVPDPWSADDGGWRRSASDTLDQVKRHIDGGRKARIEYDVSATCSHCGARWTSPDVGGWNNCCDKDQETWTAAQLAAHDALIAIGWPADACAAIRDCGDQDQSDTLARSAMRGITTPGARTSAAVVHALRVLLREVWP